MNPSAQLATSSAGTQIIRKCLRTLKVIRERDPTHGWLNDEIVGACMQYVVDYGLRTTNHKSSEVPKYHQFNSFFCTNLREKRVRSVAEWALKVKTGSEKLLNVERVFILVHSVTH